MSGRNSRSKNDNAGCMFTLFESIVCILLLLFTSKDPIAKKSVGKL